MTVGLTSSTQQIGTGAGRPWQSPPDDCAPSWQSRCIIDLLWLLRVKRRLASAAAVRARVRALALRPDPHEPTGLGRGVVATSMDIAQMPVYCTAPSANRRARDLVVFLHGGGYINEIVRAHWRFVGYLNRRAGVRCVVPIYPLAPRATAKDVVPAVGEVVRQTMREAAGARVTLVGNSAGAGLALAAAQWLRDLDEPLPAALILISPGLDARIDRAEQAAIAARDPISDVAGARECMRLYAGDLDLAHPYVSPLNGRMRGLPPMLVFSGTSDLFHPDSVDLAAKARAAGVPVELHVRHGQPHNYPSMPTPEGRQAREAILRAVVEARP